MSQQSPGSGPVGSPSPGGGGPGTSSPTPGQSGGGGGGLPGGGIPSGGGPSGSPGGGCSGGGGRLPLVIGDPGWGEDLNVFDYYNKVRLKGQNELGNDSDLRHCTASCYAASNRGVDLTRIMGIANEVEGFLRWDIVDSILIPEHGLERWITHTRPRAADTRDVVMNEIGIAGSKNNHSWGSCLVYCQTAPRPPINPPGVGYTPIWVK
jgi:hypothetical protein